MCTYISTPYLKAGCSCFPCLRSDVTHWVVLEQTGHRDLCANHVPSFKAWAAQCKVLGKRGPPLIQRDLHIVSVHVWLKLLRAASMWGREYMILNYNLEQEIFELQCQIQSVKSMLPQIQNTSRGTAYTPLTVLISVMYHPSSSGSRKSAFTFHRCAMSLGFVIDVPSSSR